MSEGKTTENQTFALIEIKDGSAETTKKEDERFNVDDLLTKFVKPFGLWQWSIVILLTLSNGSPITFPVYANSAAGHRCKMEERVEQYFKLNNLTFDEITQIIMPGTQNKRTVIGGCERYAIDWNRTDIAKLVLIHQAGNESVEKCPYGYIFENSIYHYPGNVISEFETICDRSWLVPLGTSLYMCGSAVGNLLGGWCGGRLGRRKTIMLLALTELIGNIWATMSSSHLSYVIARSLVGVGATGKSNISGVLILEITLADYRAIFRAILSLSLAFAYRGLLALWAYYIPYWRWLNVAVLSPNLLSILYIFLLPESPRWLFSQKKYQEGMQVLIKAYRVNHWRKPKTHLNTLYDLEEQAYEYEKSLHIAECKMSRNVCRHCSILAPLSSKKTRKTTLLSTIVMFGVSVSFYGLLLYARSVKHYVYLTGFLNAVMGLLGLTLFAILYRCTRYRKRPLLVIFGIIFTVLLISATYTVFARPNTDIVLIICSNVALCLLQASLNMGVLYIPELFPSTIRTEGLGFVLGIAKLGGILCSFVNALDGHLVHGSPMFVYAGGAFVMAITLLFLEDTSGVNLPDR